MKFDGAIIHRAELDLLISGMADRILIRSKLLAL
jgi:hypothetical protein